MFRAMTAALLLAALGGAPGLAASAACAGADPAIVSVTVKGVSPSSGLNNYELTGTVVNNGSAQDSNVLQFVDILQNGQKLDAKAVPPLAAGQSYTFTYVSQRSKDAGLGSSKLTFQMDVTQPSGVPNAADCDASNDSFTLTF